MVYTPAGFSHEPSRLLNDDAGGGHLDNRQRRIINAGGGSWSGGDCDGGGRGDGTTGCTGGRRGAGATHGTGIAEALGTVVLLRTVEEAQVELTAGVERHLRREGVRRRGAAQTRAQRLIEFENVHCTGIERSSASAANNLVRDDVVGDNSAFARARLSIPGCLGHFRSFRESFSVVSMMKR